MTEWTVTALKYAERNTRTRADSFLMEDGHDTPHAMDYFIWVLRSADRLILVDTGYTQDEGARRGRPILRDPAEALGAIGLRPDDIDTVIITHLHYDHAGGLDHFPNATFHLQAAEMAFATGPCMCEHAMNHPFTADHICAMVKRVYSGRVIFHDGEGAVSEGVTVHCIGGHSKGLQAVRVRTASGWMCLASDTAHYYENFLLAKPFPLVVDVEAMLKGFHTIQTLASARSLIIPGHDPMVTTHFPPEGHSGFAWRLDHGPLRMIEGMT